MTDDPGRPRGILSPADRSYLRGETTPGSVQSERNTRARIRERLLAGLRDFELLVDRLEDRDRDLVFERFDPDEDGDVRAPVAAVALLYRGVEETPLSFGTVLEEGISMAEAERGRAAAVDFDVRVESLDPDRLARKLRRTGSLTLSELAYLREREDVDLDDLFARYAADAPDDDGDWVQSKVTNF